MCRQPLEVERDTATKQIAVSYKNRILLALRQVEELLTDFLTHTQPRLGAMKQKKP